MAQTACAFGPFLLDPAAGTLLRDGTPVSIGYRGFCLLAALVARPGEVLTKSTLIEAAWPNMVVEEGNLQVQIALLRKLLGRSPDVGEWIATIPRVGYRFAGRVDHREPGLLPADQAASEPSIAVLPFVNLSSDPAQEYFADGLTEDIITGLSRIRWVLVSARNSSFAYKGKPVDLKQIGRDLGVRYALEGSVRRAGKRLRITAQLNDASTGRQVWAERYDGSLGDFFALQDEITASVIASIEPKLYAAENVRLRSKPTESLDAWGYVMRAMPHVWTWGSEKDIGLAENLLRRATELDPDYARANSLLAWPQGVRAHLGWADSYAQVSAALALAERAIARDFEDPWGHLAAGYAHMIARRFAPAIEELGEAINRNPSFVHAHMILGSAYAYGGMVDEGMRETSLAMRLSPGDYAYAANLSVIGLCHLLAGRFGQAVEFERRAVQLRPYFGTAWRTLTAAAGLAGELDVARRALSEATRLQPSLSVSWVEEYHPVVHAKHRAMYIDGLRAAGLE
jgi:TolB-like protein/Flp pilus assembly protein TadD